MSFPSNFLWGGATSSVQYEGGFDQGGRGLGHMDFIPCLTEEQRRTQPSTFNQSLEAFERIQAHEDEYNLASAVVPTSTIATRRTLPSLPRWASNASA